MDGTAAASQRKQFASAESHFTKTIFIDVHNGAVSTASRVPVATTSINDPPKFRQDARR